MLTFCHKIVQLQITFCYKHETSGLLDIDANCKFCTIFFVLDESVLSKKAKPAKCSNRNHRYLKMLQKQWTATLMWCYLNQRTGYQQNRGWVGSLVNQPTHVIVTSTRRIGSCPCDTESESLLWEMHLIPIKCLAKEEAARLYERAVRFPPDNPLGSSAEDEIHGHLGLLMKSCWEVGLEYSKEKLAWMVYHKNRRLSPVHSLHGLHLQETS